MNLTEQDTSALAGALAAAAPEGPARLNAPASTVQELISRGLAYQDPEGPMLTPAGWIAAARLRDGGHDLELGAIVVYAGSLTEEHGNLFTVLANLGGTYILGCIYDPAHTLSGVRRCSVHPTGAHR